ncbi:hypothetical protein [Paraburkholderia acidiphila]|uniref:Uncharacterized protein n=1 Tax=Paraburkholderia acidiphila TaxID=2571747 RepID=A0A7Z2G917_9BURK|nr:hypothetical protein [Paraburkholderia acidiphila]QGZ57280.1 hypothetical protein FAZ97_20390 [Paraburkholderia acidiphila]
MNSDRQLRWFNFLWRARVRNSLIGCDKLISEASKDDLQLDSQSVATVRRAHAALAQGNWTSELEVEFHSAVDKIRDTLFFPSARIYADIKHGDDLVSYASLAGIDLIAADVESVSQARMARRNREWTANVEARFYTALSRIAHAVTPVEAATAGSAARKGARKAIRMYSYFTIPLTLIVISLSCLLYIANQISQDVTRLVAANDIEAMRLHNELESHATSIIEAKQNGERALRKLRAAYTQSDVSQRDEKDGEVDINQKTDSDLRMISNSPTALQIKDTLQQFAINNRELFSDVRRTDGIGSRLYIPVNNPYYNQKECDKKDTESIKTTASQVKSAPTAPPTNWLCDSEKVRKNLEITVPMLEADHVIGEIDGHKNMALSPERDVDEGFQKIAAYQDIRAMAVYGRDIILSLVGIVTGFVLPVLYSWLGACASILRKINAECASSTFHPENSTVENRSHVTCAIIVGISIGLLSDLIEGGKSFSPLAIAFVAGYSSDKFFHFIDRLVDSLFPMRTSEKGRVPGRRHSNFTVGQSD